MQNTPASVCRPRKKRKTITVCLEANAAEQLDKLAKRSKRSRSRLSALMLEHMIRIIHLADEPEF